MQKTPKETVLDLLGLMLGADLVDAMEAAFDTDDFTSLQSTLPTLGSAGVCALHQPAFEAACRQGRADVAASLLGSSRVDPNRMLAGGTVLQYAVVTNNVELVQVLAADARVDVNQDSVLEFCPLAAAAERGHVACLEALLSCARTRVNVCDRGGTVFALGMAAYHGHLACVQALMADSRLDVNYAGDCSNTNTALMESIFGNQPACLKALLTADAIDVNQNDADKTEGWSALAITCDNNRTACAEVLLARASFPVLVCIVDVRQRTSIEAWDRASTRLATHVHVLPLRGVWRSSLASGCASLCVACGVLH